ncbi:MerR family transcriptional regulator [Vagococcus sp. JNUCC 83]
MVFSIGEFSKEVNILIDTLRYYEKEHLIVSKRNRQNQRIYTESDIIWIDFIKKLKQTGMSIKDIKVYASLRNQGDTTIEERMALLYKQQEVLEDKKRETEEHINFLNHKINVYKKMMSDKQTEA